jgi:xylan 1,4-beta-xylosidase
MPDAWRTAFGRQGALYYFERLRRVQELVDAHLGEVISVGDAARVACLEPKYFSHYFRDKVGIGFREWLAARRIQYATTEFRRGDYPVSQVAFGSGFGSYRSFERWFVRVVGVTPADYKRRVRAALR